MVRATFQEGKEKRRRERGKRNEGHRKRDMPATHTTDKPHFSFPAVFSHKILPRRWIVMSHDRMQCTFSAIGIALACGYLALMGVIALASVKQVTRHNPVFES